MPTWMDSLCGSIARSSAGGRSRIINCFSRWLHIRPAALRFIEPLRTFQMHKGGKQGNLWRLRWITGCYELSTVKFQTNLCFHLFLPRITFSAMLQLKKQYCWSSKPFQPLPYGILVKYNAARCRTYDKILKNMQHFRFCMEGVLSCVFQRNDVFF